MKTMKTAERKSILIGKILSNDTYTRESGLYQRLAAILEKQSVDTLADLSLIVEMKERFAAQNPARWTE